MEPTAKPWWKSVTFWGVLVAFLSDMLGRYGVAVAAEDQKQIVGAIVMVVDPVGKLVGFAMAIWGRFRARQTIAPVIAPPPPPPGVTSALLAATFAALLGVALTGCTGAQLETARAVGMQVGRVAYEIECKTDVVDQIGGVVTASIKARDAAAAAKLRAGLAAHSDAVALACPLARAVEVVVARR